MNKTAFASYAVALALLKEESNLDSEQTDQLYEDFYKLLKEEDVFEPDMLSEATEVGKLCSLRMNGGDYHLRRQIKQNFDEDGEIKIYPEKDKNNRCQRILHRLWCSYLRRKNRRRQSSIHCRRCILKKYYIT